MELTTYSAGGELAPVLDRSLFERWEQFIDASPRTAEAYTANIRRFAAYLDAQGISSPTRATVLDYKRALLEDHKPTTVSAYLAAVRLFFRWTAQEGIYPNIADNVKGAKLTRDHKRDALTAAECAGVLDGIDRQTLRGARDYALLWVMMCGGLRCIEAQRADVQDIATRGGKTRLYLQGKGRAERTEYADLSPEALDAISYYMKLRTAAEGRRPDGSAPLFAATSRNNPGGRMTTRAISGAVKDALRAAGYDDSRLTAHSLRHSAVSNALRGGEDLRAVSMFARHADISTTLIYAHDLDREDNTCAATIGRMIREGGAPARNAE